MRLFILFVLARPCASYARTDPSTHIARLIPPPLVPDRAKTRGGINLDYEWGIKHDFQIGHKPKGGLT